MIKGKTNNNNSGWLGCIKATKQTVMKITFTITSTTTTTTTTTTTKIVII